MLLLPPLQQSNLLKADRCMLVSESISGATDTADAMLSDFLQNHLKIWRRSWDAETIEEAKSATKVALLEEQFLELHVSEDPLAFIKSNVQHDLRKSRRFQFYPIPGPRATNREQDIVCKVSLEGLLESRGYSKREIRAVIARFRGYWLEGAGSGLTKWERTELYRKLRDDSSYLVDNLDISGLIEFIDRRGRL